MQWEKLGLIYKPAGEDNWKMHSALTPSPVVFEDKVRVYAGLRDKEGISRIGYVDLDKNDPTKVIKVSEKPVIDIGVDGSFDDNGVILGDIIRVGDKLYMYYVGFQLVKKVKFMAFTGLAISGDSGETFAKYSQVPVLDRRENALCCNAVHTVIYKDNKFRCWLGAGSTWATINDVLYPSYNVKCIESSDGIHFDQPSIDCLKFSRPGEYRMGRPKVYETPNGYEMIFTWGDLEGNYRMGYAVSKDGMNWERKDDEVNFHPSADGWDNKWVSYGALFNVNNQTYMVYNGNEMGKDGFGLAILKNKS
jgi:hypothetical protein